MAWYESEAFWDLGKPFMFGPAAWDRARGEVDGVLALLGVPPGGRILDLCCGPGRHALELARRRFEVTGVDRHGPYLDSARSAARAEGLEIELVQCDMRDFVRAEAFDGAINLFTAFGYFADLEDDRRVLRNLYTSLRPGCRLAIDLMGKDVLLRRLYLGRRWSEVDGVLALEERAIDLSRNWIHGRDIYVTPTGRQEVEIEHRLYSGAGLRTLLESSGFSQVRLYGDFDGSPYDLDARRLLAVATK
jgi:SAM-dependent methyltransferase